MKKSLRYTISDVEIPEYLFDILLSERCPSFLKMSIIKEQNACEITYNTAYFQNVQIGELEMVDRLRLFQDIFYIKNDCDDCLVSSEEYMILPELIYKRVSATGFDRAKLLFYPDVHKNKFEQKALALFAKLFSDADKEECASLQNIELFLSEGDIGRAERHLVRLIDRFAVAA